MKGVLKNPRENQMDETNRNYIISIKENFSGGPKGECVHVMAFFSSMFP
jgi:hypothetical protein